jgi:hypothetical protein
MEYDTRTYFKEHDAEDVKGFTILEAKNAKYHIAEKWLALDERTEDKWLDYWITEDDLASRVSDEKCEPVGTLSDDQFEGVCKKSDSRALNEVPA